MWVTTHHNGYIVRLFMISGISKGHLKYPLNLIQRVCRQRWRDVPRQKYPAGRICASVPTNFLVHGVFCLRKIESYSAWTATNFWRTSCPVYGHPEGLSVLTNWIQYYLCVTLDSNEWIFGSSIAICLKASAHFLFLFIYHYPPWEFTIICYSHSLHIFLRQRF